MDVSHDYMKIICDYVTEKNNVKNTIYDIIRKDFKNYLENYNPQEEYGDDGCDIDHMTWVTSYVDKMSIDSKNDIIIKFGFARLLTILPDIAKENCFEDFESFLYDNSDEDFTQTIVLSYIVTNYIVNDIFEF